jgi:hypothetical protein
MEPVSERQQILYRQVPHMLGFQTGRPSFTALFRGAACARRELQTPSIEV